MPAEIENLGKSRYLFKDAARGKIVHAIWSKPIFLERALKGKIAETNGPFGDRSISLDAMIVTLPLKKIPSLFKRQRTDRSLGPPVIPLVGDFAVGFEWISEACGLSMDVPLTIPHKAEKVKDDGRRQLSKV